MEDRVFTAELARRLHRRGNRRREQERVFPKLLSSN
jgi:hypothetical protein